MAPTAVRRVRPLVAAVASAALYGLAFPPLGTPALAWVALVPLFVAIRRTTPGRAALLAWLWLTVMAYVVGDCLPGAVSTYFGQSRLFGVAFATTLFWLQGAPHYMAFAAWYAALGRRSGAVSPLVVAAGWVVAEMARMKILSGNPWALLGYSQMEVLPLVQIADVTGVYGISFACVAVDAALAELWLARDDAAVRGRALLGAAAAAAVGVAVVAYGVRCLAEAPAVPSGDTPIAIVQGNLDLGAQWRSDLYGRNLDAYMRLTDQAARAARPAIVFWPENAMTFFLNQEPLYQRALQMVLAPSGAELVAGGPRVLGADTAMPVYYNSAYLLSPAGGIVAVYDKERLLPFSEYFPIDLDVLRRRFERVRTFTPGAPTPPLPTIAGPAGILICNEAVFPDIAAARVRAGAGYLVNIANDTWLGDWKYAVRVFDLVALRAVEQRRWLVRVSTSGPSAVVDPWGRVEAKTAPFTETTAAAEIASRTGRTPYARVGDAFGWLCAVVAGAALVRRRAALDARRRS